MDKLGSCIKIISVINKKHKRQGEGRIEGYDTFRSLLKLLGLFLFFHLSQQAFVEGPKFLLREKEEKEIVGPGIIPGACL